jgi:hypothetical protein
VHQYTVEADPEKDLREATASLIVQRGWGLREMGSVAMSLEDVYIQLTTAESGPPQGESAAGEEENA